MKSDISILHNRSYHLRNLSLFHCCNAWSIMHRGYPVSDFEFYGSEHWDGFISIVHVHHLKPKPREKFRTCYPVFSSEYVQLTLNFD